MCIISNNIQFCTCNSGDYEALPHYWILYRCVEHNDIVCIGQAFMPVDCLLPNYHINKHTLEKRLNEPEAFDKAIEFRDNDQLEIVINNLAGNEFERMTFYFKFSKSLWIEGEPDPFELVSLYDEYAFGSVKRLEED